MRARNRDVRIELASRLRAIDRPALYIIDNVPEAAPGADPRPLSDFCPAVGSVTVLATSRQDTQESGVVPLAVGPLSSDAAVLLLTNNVAGSGQLSWSEWVGIAEWVGCLPIALDLLNRCLAVGSLSPSELLTRTSDPLSAGPTSELDRLRDTLRGQLPPNSVYAITEAFLISFDQLEEDAMRL